jgi:hypothetical protein
MTQLENLNVRRTLVHISLYLKRILTTTQLARTNVDGFSFGFYLFFFDEAEIK